MFNQSDKISIYTHVYIYIYICYNSIIINNMFKIHSNVPPIRMHLWYVYYCMNPIGIRISCNYLFIFYLVLLCEVTQFF